MTDNPDDATPQSENGQPQGRAGRRSCLEDHREGPAHRPHRQGQGQIDGRVRPAAARARARLQGRRRAVRQGCLGYRRAHAPFQASAIRSSGTRSAKASPGKRRTASATSPPPSAPGRRRSSSWPIPPSACSSSMSSTSRCATIISTSPRSWPTLAARRPDLHIVVTGRNAKPELIEAADLVTEMVPLKHHFDAGVRAQEGIEY